MLGFLSLPLAGFSSRPASTTGAFAELGFLLCLSSTSLGLSGGFSIRLNLSDGTIDVGGVCNFVGSVSLQQKFEATDRPVLELCVMAQFYLASKGKYILEA